MMMPLAAGVGRVTPALIMGPRWSMGRPCAEHPHPTMGRRPSLQSFPMIRHRQPRPVPLLAETLRGRGPWRPISTSRFRTGRAQVTPPHVRHSQAFLVSVDPVAGQQTVLTVAARVAPGFVAFVFKERRSVCRVLTLAWARWTSRLGRGQKCGLWSAAQLAIALYNDAGPANLGHACLRWGTGPG